jgi:Flp pilus assembly protein TadD
VLILLGLPALIYLPSLANDFVWDDHGIIGSHAWVQELRHIPFLFSPEYWNQYFPGIKGQYRPLRSITLSLQYAVWGLNPVPYHAFNVLFHLLNVWLVHRLLLRLTGRRGVSWVGALLFGLHPMHTEVVAWIKNRTEIMALMFSLLSLEGYLRAQEALGRRRRAGWAAASTLACALAILSKEVALGLPLIAIAHAVFLAHGRRLALACSLPLLVPVGLFVVHKLLFLQGGTDPGLPPLSLGTHAMLVLRTLGSYAVLLAVPAVLNADRALDLAAVTSGWETWACAAVVLGAVILAAFFWHRGQWLALFALAWVFIGLLPASNVHLLHTRPLADQRLYLPSVGFCLLLSLGLSALREGPAANRWRGRVGAWTMAATVLVVSLYGLRTLSRIGDWRDDQSLIRHTLRHSPDSARPRFQMALLLQRNGDLDGAAREFQRTIELSPALAEPHNYLGVIYAEKRDHQRAVRSFSRALQLKPDYPQALANMAIPLVELGREAEADRALQQAVELAPREPLILTHLGIIRGRMGRFPEAVEALDRALAEEPGNIKALVHRAYAHAEMGNLDRCVEDLRLALSWMPASASIRVELSTALRKKGEVGQARTILEEALALDPSDANVRTAMGNFLAGMGDLDGAVPHFREAVRLSPNQALPYHNLGRVLEDAGRFHEAEIPLRQAVEIDPRNPRFMKSLASVLRKAGKADEAGQWEDRLRGWGKEEPSSSTAPPRR